MASPKIVTTLTVTLLVLGVLTGTSFWLITLFYSYAASGGRLTADGVMLHGLFSVLQGTAAFIAFTLMMAGKTNWEKTVLFGLSLWALGVAPLTFTDLMARYFGALPTRIGPEGQLLQEVGFDLVLALLCTTFAKYIPHYGIEPLYRVTDGSCT